MLVHARRHAWYLYASTIVALFGLLWVSLFGLERAVSEGRSRWNFYFSKPCCVAFITPLRMGSMLVVTAVAAMTSWQRFVAEAESDDDDAADSNDVKGLSAALKRVLYVAAGIALLACAGALIVRQAAHAAILRSLRESGLTATVKVLQDLGGVLCVNEAVHGAWATEAGRHDADAAAAIEAMDGHVGEGRRRVDGVGSGSASTRRTRTTPSCCRRTASKGHGGWERKLAVAQSPQQLRRLLLIFEEQVLAERLSREFVVARRDTWRSECEAASSFAQVNRLAQELEAAVRTRPSSLFQKMIVRRVLAMHCSARWEENRILSFLLPPFYDDFGREVLNPEPSAPRGLRFPEAPKSTTDTTGKNAMESSRVSFGYHMHAAARKLNAFHNNIVVRRQEAATASAAAASKDNGHKGKQDNIPAVEPGSQGGDITQSQEGGWLGFANSAIRAGVQKAREFV